jgi:hypothetical protein
MGTPRDAVVVVIVAVLAIHLALGMLTRHATTPPRRPATVPPARSDASDGDFRPIGDRWI